MGRSKLPRKEKPGSLGVCLQCNTSFKKWNKNSKFCSKSCSRKGKKFTLGRNFSQQELLEFINYSPETGKFFSLKPLPGREAGKELGTYVNSAGYYFIYIGYKPYLAHRLAWFYMKGEWPVGPLDHINRIKTDNRWKNLREATYSENNFNKKARKSSLYKGVIATGAVYAKPWWVRVWDPKTRRYVSGGRFDKQEEAALAYNKLALILQGEFAYQNKVIL